MKKKNIFWMVAAIVNLGTAFLHLIGGQMDLVNPLLESDLSAQARSEWLGVWHMVTVVLFVSAIYLLRCAFSKSFVPNVGVVKTIAVIYTLFFIPFVFSSIYTQTFAPQWILLTPIGVLAYLGINKHESNLIKSL